MGLRAEAWIPAVALVAWTLAVTGVAALLGVNPLLFVVANVAFFTDGVDFVTRLVARGRARRLRRDRCCDTSVDLHVDDFTPEQVVRHLRPYALLVSVRNASLDIEDFIENLGSLRRQLWIYDDASTDATWFVLNRAGVHAVRGQTNLRKPGGIRALLAQLPSETRTVLVLDPDCRILESADGPEGSTLERVVFEFQRSGHAAASTNIVVREDGWLARLQDFEYRLTCLVGKSCLGDRSVTSGAALYRRDALEAALSRHSLSVYAEDLENSLILHRLGETVYHDERLVLETEGKLSLLGLMRQRIGWSYGFLRVYSKQLRRLWGITRGRPMARYNLFVYLGLFGIFLFPLRILGVLLTVASLLGGLGGLVGLPVGPFTDPVFFLSVYLHYAGLAFVASAFVARGSWATWRTLLQVIPLYPVYALSLAVPAAMGYVNWLTELAFGKRVFFDPYDPGSTPRLEGAVGTP